MPSSEVPPVEGSQNLHAIELTSSFLDGYWTATCLCGWQGAQRDTMREASADSMSHLEFVALGGSQAKGSE